MILILKTASENSFYFSDESGLKFSQNQYLYSNDFTSLEKDTITVL